MSMVELAKERCPQLVQKAEFLCKTFTKAFKLFGACHALYYDSSNVLEETDMDDLRK